MLIEKQIIIQASIESAWKTLGEDFGKVSDWASIVDHSEGAGDSFEGSSCSERGCDTQIGGLKEKLVHFDPVQYSLSYVVYEGMPSMVSRAFNLWRLSPVDKDNTRLFMQMEISVSGFLGVLMQPMLKMKFSKLGTELLEEFKVFVETGTPHTRKLKAMAEQKATV